MVLQTGNAVFLCMQCYKGLPSPSIDILSRSRLSQSNLGGKTATWGPISSSRLGSEAPAGMFGFSTGDFNLTGTSSHVAPEPARSWHRHLSLFRGAVDDVMYAHRSESVQAAVAFSVPLLLLLVEASSISFALRHLALCETSWSCQAFTSFVCLVLGHENASCLELASRFNGTARTIGLVRGSASKGTFHQASNSQHELPWLLN